MEIRRLLHFAILFLLCLALVGGACSESSDPIATGSMTADFEAVADGSGSTEVVAELQLTPRTRLRWVTLRGGDELYAARVDPVTMRVTTREMLDRFDIIGESYGTSFGSDARDTRFEVAFDRSGRDGVSAPDSWVTLPTDFVLDWVDDPVALTPAPTTFSRSSATPYYVVWDPFDAPNFEPGDSLEFRVTGNCIWEYGGVIDWSAGEDVLPLAGVLRDRPPPDDGLSCPIEVELTLSRRGSVDPAYAGGEFRGEQVRVLNLQSTP